MEQTNVRNSIRTNQRINQNYGNANCAAFVSDVFATVRIEWANPVGSNGRDGEGEWDVGNDDGIRLRYHSENQIKQTHKKHLPFHWIFMAINFVSILISEYVGHYALSDAVLGLQGARIDFSMRFYYSSSWYWNGKMLGNRRMSAWTKQVFHQIWQLSPQWHFWNHSHEEMNPWNPFGFTHLRWKEATYDEISPSLHISTTRSHRQGTVHEKEISFRQKIIFPLKTNSARI